MFVISRCQTPLNPRLGWEGRTPVNKAEKRPPGPLKGHPGCGSSPSGPCFATPFLECLHTAKSATPGQVLESDVLAAFSVSSWVAMGKWTVFFRQPDQAPGRTPCGFHSPPALENVSSVAWLCRFLLSGHSLIFHLQMSYHSAWPGSVVDAVLPGLGITKQSWHLTAHDC